jgi:hypothetical protein
MIAKGSGCPSGFVAPMPESPGEVCGLPVDAEHFDESSTANTPPPGREVRLARFALSPQYCGRFENFCQFSDLQQRDNAEIDTPGLQWLVLINNRPLYPFLALERIINPWGWGSFPVSVRLDENAVVELVVRNVSYAPAANQPAIRRVGGRILGRFWFNPAYNNASRRR